MPDIDEHIWDVYRDRGVLVYGLHADDDPQLLADFVEQTGITFPIVHSQLTILDFDFPVVGYPFPRQVLIDKNRTVRDIKHDLDVQTLATDIDALLLE